MNTEELLNEACKRQAQALGEKSPTMEEVLTGEGDSTILSGQQNLLRYLSVLGIEDEEVFIEWAGAQATAMIVQMGGPMNLMVNPLGSIMSALLAGTSLGYQLALLREEADGD